MGRFDSGQQRAAELEAYQALWNLWHTSRRAAVDISNWESACEMLQTYYTVAQARQDSEVCAMRIRYLQISEPLPRLVYFVPHRRIECLMPRGSWRRPATSSGSRVSAIPNVNGSV